LKNFLEETKDDWNYITPIDFYKNYYNKKPFILDLRQKMILINFIYGDPQIFFGLI